MEALSKYGQETRASLVPPYSGAVRPLRGTWARCPRVSWFPPGPPPPPAPGSSVRTAQDSGLGASSLCLAARRGQAEGGPLGKWPDKVQCVRWGRVTPRPGKAGSSGPKPSGGRSASSSCDGRCLQSYKFGTDKCGSAFGGVDGMEDDSEKRAICVPKSKETGHRGREGGPLGGRRRSGL